METAKVLLRHYHVVQYQLQLHDVRCHFVIDCGCVDCVQNMRGGKTAERQILKKDERIHQYDSELIPSASEKRQGVWKPLHFLQSESKKRASWFPAGEWREARAHSASHPTAVKYHTVCAPSLQPHCGLLSAWVSQNCVVGGH